MRGTTNGKNNYRRSLVDIKNKRVLAHAMISEEIKMDENKNAAIAKRLELHKKWLYREDGGIKLEEHGAGLCGADLTNVTLRGANLYGARLYRTRLYKADLRGANLSEADLSEAELSEAELSGANLYRAELRGTNLNGASTANALFISLQCPEEGSFIAWKRCGKHIVKLQVTETAKRSSATSRKCRCSEALVLDIQKEDGSPSGLTEIKSSYDPSFIYRVGEVARVDDFNEDRWNECSAGIHFFITRDEAVYYG